MSFTPPGANGRTMRTGRVGKYSTSNRNDLHCQRATNLHIGNKNKSAEVSKSKRAKIVEQPSCLPDDDREPWWQRKRDLDCPTRSAALPRIDATCH
jgi:hypothetical protein